MTSLNNSCEEKNNIEREKETYERKFQSGLIELWRLITELRSLSRAQNRIFVFKFLETVKTRLHVRETFKMYNEREPMVNLPMSRFLFHARLRKILSRDEFCIICVCRKNAYHKLLVSPRIPMSNLSSVG